MANSKSRSGVFSGVNRLVGGAVDAIAFARGAMQISDTPDHVFTARGTTREKALRDFINRF